jgi:hypothetical protein
MRNLWFISCFVLVMTSCSFRICKNTQIENIANQRVMSGFPETLNVRKLKTKITYKTTEISGILICKKINDSTLAGGFINEFGIKWFDFTISESRAKLGYLFKSLDKWYLRRTFETDLHFLFSRPKLQTTCSINDTSVYVAAINRSLHYVYYFADDNRMERADLYRGESKIANLRQYSDELSGVTLRMVHSDGSLRYEFCEMNN